MPRSSSSRAFLARSCISQTWGDRPVWREYTRMSVVKETWEDLERKSRLKAGGYGFEWLVDRVARQLALNNHLLEAGGFAFAD